MNEALKKFSAELLKDFQQALLKNQTEELLTKIKGADPELGGTFKVVISTSDEDRQGDKLDQSKWNLENYKKNPVVLWAHDYYQLPIGMCTSISVEGGKLVAEGKFTSSDINAFGAQVGALHNSGYINATSVGYMQHEDGDLELLEFSFVPVPANPFALTLRDVKRLNLNMPELVMKGLAFVTKSPQVGDRCELEDGTPGVLSENDNGEITCVPEQDEKGAQDEKNKNNMENDLTKSLKAEHGRHGEEVMKAIDEFSEKCMKGEKAAGADEYAKAIEEFGKAIDGEQDTHLEKCMKAIDDSYETMGREPNKDEKAIDEFKAAFNAEHENHVKCFGKAIDEFKKDWPDGDPKESETRDKCDKAIDEFGEKAETELARHEKAHMELCESAMREGEDDEAKTFIAEIVRSVALEKLTEKEVLEISMKVGRQISAATKAKIQTIMKMIEDGSDAHQKSHKEAADNVIAALKDLMGPDGGNEGEEPKPKGAAPKPRSRPAGAAPNADAEPDVKMSEFEAFMFARKILRAVNSATGKSLGEFNEIFRKKFPDRR